MIGSAVISVRIIGAQSLKEKRGILLSIMRRTRNKFNAAVAEVGSQDLWQRSDIGVAVVSSTVKHAEQQLQQVIKFIEADPLLEVMTLEIDVF
ncbi:MAG TPA: DUF503 domain-containing protein [Firmicutes bacterium]|nr:DUF503 domain-containing protein [Bacillota bacterium]